MMKAESALRRVIEPAPIAQRLLKQSKGASDIGFDERRRSVDRAVDVALGSEIHHRARRVGLEQFSERGPVADIDLSEAIAMVACRLRDRIEIRGVSQLVNIDDVRFGLVEQMADHGGADKAGAAGNENRGAAKPHGLRAPSGATAQRSGGC